jgi:hypothetical protein
MEDSELNDLFIQKKYSYVVSLKYKKSQRFFYIIKNIYNLL